MRVGEDITRFIIRRIVTVDGQRNINRDARREPQQKRKSDHPCQSLAALAPAPRDNQRNQSDDEKCGETQPADPPRASLQWTPAQRREAKRQAR